MSYDLTKYRYPFCKPINRYRKNAKFNNTFVKYTEQSLTNFKFVNTKKILYYLLHKIANNEISIAL